MPAPLPFNPNFPGGKIVVGPGAFPAVLKAGGPLWNAGGVGANWGDGSKLKNAPTFEEIDGYKEEWRNDGTQSVTRYFKTPWGSRWLFRDWMLGYSNTVPTGNALGLQYYLSRTIPDQIPEVGGQHLYCSDCRMVGGKGVWANNPTVFATDDGVPAGFNLVAGGGFGGPVPAGGPGGVALDANGNPVPAAMIAYFDPATGEDGLAIYECVYTPRQYEVRSDAALVALGGQDELERYVEFAIQPAIQTIPLPSGSIIFTPGTGAPNAGNPVAANANFLYLHTNALTYTWHDVPDYPDDAIAACTGAVNAGAFDGAKGRKQRPAGTLLCQAPLKVERYRHTTGRVYWRITYSMLSRVFTNPLLPGQFQGWNSLPDSDGKLWPVQRKDGSPLYPTADFNQLFTAPPPVSYQ